jgi:hypothetical protein
MEDTATQMFLVVQERFWIMMVTSAFNVIHTQELKMITLSALQMHAPIHRSSCQMVPVLNAQVMPTYPLIKDNAFLHHVSEEKFLSLMEFAEAAPCTHIQILREETASQTPTAALLITKESIKMEDVRHAQLDTD